jgi:succinoglycan biosynthesis protein ExoA
MDLSVLVPIRNEAAFIRDTFRAITAQQFDGSVEFLMIDGRSQDDTRAILDELAAQDERVAILDNPRGDLASALCAGLSAAKGEFVAKMDAHTYFPPSYLQAGVDRLRQGDVNWVSGPQIPRGVDLWSRRVALALGTRLGMGGSGKWSAAFEAGAGNEKELDTGVFSGVWRRSVLERLGGWDPGWPVNEDSELASRYLVAGERILCLRSMGAHYVPRGSLRGLARQYSRYGYYRAKTANRHPASMRPSHVAPPALMFVLSAGALGGRCSRRLAGLSLLGYAAAQTLTCLRVAQESGEYRDAAMLPAVLTTMHLSFGAGYLAGCLRFGAPLEGLGRLAGLMVHQRWADRPPGS